MTTHLLREIDRDKVIPQYKQTKYGEPGNEEKSGFNACLSAIESTGLEPNIEEMVNTLWEDYRIELYDPMTFEEMKNSEPHVYKKFFKVCQSIAEDKRCWKLTKI